MGHLAGVALLDRNRGAVRRGEVDGRQRCGHIERNLVRVRHHRDRIGADLVGEVAVGRDAIRADDDEVDVAALHERPGHALGDDGRRDVIAHEFPGRQPRALQERPRLVGEHLPHLALLRGGANDAERRAVPGGRERAGVAVRQNARVFGHDVRAEPAHRLAASTSSS